MAVTEIKMSTDKNNDKASIRSLILAKRKNLSRKYVIEKSGLITEHVLSLKEYKEADCVFAYISLNNEADMHDLLLYALKSGKRVAVPRVCKTDMDFYYIDSLERLVKGSFGILEPFSDALPAEYEKNAVMLIPGVAYDMAGNRIGYGGGYYDRYFAKQMELKTNLMNCIIAPAYEFQITDEIPSEEHDIRVNKIVTENGCLI